MHYTLPETNKSALQIDGWKMNVPYINFGHADGSYQFRTQLWTSESEQAHLGFKNLPNSKIIGYF